MNKEQELIDELQEYLYIEDRDIDISLYDEEIIMCIDALEKQIPKKLHKYANGTEHCACCDYDNTTLRFKYCIECGQSLDWGE